VSVCRFSYESIINSTKLRTESICISKQVKSSMPSSAPDVRGLDCEHLEHDQNDLEWIATTNTRDQRSGLSGSMTNARKIAPSDRERSNPNAECTQCQDLDS